MKAPVPRRIGNDVRNRGRAAEVADWSAMTCDDRVEPRNGPPGPRRDTSTFKEEPSRGDDGAVEPRPRQRHKRQALASVASYPATSGVASLVVRRPSSRQARCFLDRKVESDITRDWDGLLSRFAERIATTVANLLAAVP